jgi:hypothetical protein
MESTLPGIATHIVLLHSPSYSASGCGILQMSTQPMDLLYLYISSLVSSMALLMKMALLLAAILLLQTLN